MSLYVPILKGKQGELSALRNWATRLPLMTPLVEVVPWERDEGPYIAEVDDVDIQKAVKRIAQSWESKGSLAFIDSTYAEPLFEPGQEWNDVAPVGARIVRDLRSLGVNVAPAVRASAGDDYLESLRMTLGDVGSVAVRVTAEDLDDEIVPIRKLVREVVDRLGVRDDEVTVVLDFGAVGDENAMALATRLGRFVLPQLSEDPWGHVAVGGGAFPVNLSGVQAHETGRLSRFDLRLWRSLRGLKLPFGRDLGFVDYAVTHPAMPMGAAFSAPPQLRYAMSDFWLVEKGRKNDRRGHAQFYDVCLSVLKEAGAGAAGVDSSWATNTYMMLPKV